MSTFCEEPHGVASWTGLLTPATGVDRNFTIRALGANGKVELSNYYWDIPVDEPTT